MVFASKFEIPPDLRLTIDYIDDLNFAKKLFCFLKEDFTYEDILKIVKDKPELLKEIEKINEKWLKNYHNEMKNS